MNTWSFLCLSCILVQRNKFLPSGKQWTWVPSESVILECTANIVSSVCHPLCDVCRPAALSLLSFIIPLLFPMWLPASVFMWSAGRLMGNLGGFTHLNEATMPSRVSFLSLLEWIFAHKDFSFTTSEQVGYLQRRHPPFWVGNVSQCGVSSISISYLPWPLLEEDGM